nr:uncharacterized protein LOC109766638 [Aegilops tauschii subsp. strangulata]
MSQLTTFRQEALPELAAESENIAIRASALADYANVDVFFPERADDGTVVPPSWFGLDLSDGEDSVEEIASSDEGLAFRGHDESEESQNKGNFQELLELNIINQVRGQCYDGAIGASCKRKDMIGEKHREEVIKAIGYGQITTGTGLNQEQTLQRAGDTRWGSPYRTLSSLLKLFPSVMSVLKYVEKEGKSDKKCQSLQRKDQDILNAISCVKSTRNELQELRDNGWDSLLEKAYSFCEEHHIENANMQKQYLQEFDDRFNEVNSALLGHMASFNPKDSFAAFNLDNLVKLADFYPDDFDSRKMDDLGPELRTYIDNMRADERFANLDGIADLAKLMVQTNKHVTFPLVYHLLKLVLILPFATASVERCFSAMNVVKKKLRYKMGDQFMSDCLICYVEKDIFSTVTNDVVLNIFKAMKD